MRPEIERVYGLLGQALLLLGLLFVVICVFWAWQGLATLLTGLTTLAPWLAAAAILSGAVLLRVNRFWPLLAVLSLAAVDRLWLSSGTFVLGTASGLACVAGIGVLVVGKASERLNWAKTLLTLLLMALAAVLFLAPARLLTRLLQRLGLLPRERDE